MGFYDIASQPTATHSPFGQHKFGSRIHLSVVRVVFQACCYQHISYGSDLTVVVLECTGSYGWCIGGEDGMSLSRQYSSCSFSLFSSFFLFFLSSFFIFPFSFFSFFLCFYLVFKEIEKHFFCLQRNYNQFAVFLRSLQLRLQTN